MLMIAELVVIQERLCCMNALKQKGNLIVDNITFIETNFVFVLERKCKY